ncbi:MAG: YybS family protein [Clostridiaceae bacterium]
MQNSKSAKPVVEAGILSAIIVVLMIINSGFPLLGTISMFILPIPMTILTVRHNVKVSFIALLASTILGAMLIGPIAAISTLFLYGPIGITLGYCTKRKLGAVDSIQLTSIGAIIGMIGQNVIYAYLVMGTNLKGAAREFYDLIMESVTMTKEMYDSLGVSLEENPAFQSFSAFTYDKFLLMIVPVILIGGIVMAFLNYIISRNILRRMKIELKPLPAFSHWYIDNRYLAGLIIFLCLGIILQRYDIFGGEYIFVTAMYILNLVLIVIGISAVSYFLINKLRVSRLMAAIILIFIFNGFGAMFMILGFVETIMDGRDIAPISLRKLITRKFEKQ